MLKIFQSKEIANSLESIALVESDLDYRVGDVYLTARDKYAQIDISKVNFPIFKKLEKLAFVEMTYFYKVIEKMITSPDRFPYLTDFTAYYCFQSADMNRSIDIFLQYFYLQSVQTLKLAADHMPNSLLQNFFDNLIFNPIYKYKLRRFHIPAFRFEWTAGEMLAEQGDRFNERAFVASLNQELVLWLLQKKAKLTLRLDFDMRYPLLLKPR